VSGALAVAIVAAVAVAGGGLVKTRTGKEPMAVFVFVTLAGLMTFALADRLDELLAAILGAVLGAFPGGYVAWQALARNESFIWVWEVAVAFAAIGGTSFRSANLTDANFTQATLKSTDLRKAIATRTCWSEVKRLDCARVGGTILIDSDVRDLLVTGQGRKRYIGRNLKGAYLAEMDLEKADFTEADLSEANLREAKLEEAIFVRASLQGANLKGAHLKYANFREANIREAELQEADLEWANLNKASAEGTNFTRAKLSAACLGEVWIMDSKTKLEQVDCKFFYILEDPKPGTDDRERQPSIDQYAKGEFEKIHRKIHNTVQILLRNGTSREALTAGFQKVSEEDPGIRLDSIRPIDREWQHILLNIEVTEDTDKEKVAGIFLHFHELERENQRLAGYIQATKEYLKDKYSSVHIENYQHQGDNMPENIGINIKAGGNVGPVVGRDVSNEGVMNLGTISGNVTNAMNQLPTSPQSEEPGIKELLTQLQTAIEAENDLKLKDKTDALEQVKVLAKAGQNPKKEETEGLVRKAIKILKATVAELPTATKLVEACNQLLPAIAKLLGLG
jgi:uncharacterized protein YjbI with pentapeptide repeats